MMLKLPIFVFLNWYFVHKFDGIKLEINRNISGLIRSNDTSIECSYSKEEYSTNDIVSIQTFIDFSFQAIVKCFPNGLTTDRIITDAGQYLKGRSRINIISQSSTDFKVILTFETLTCADENNYLCSVAYTDENFNAKTSVSETSHLDVIVPPSVPRKITVIVPDNADSALTRNQENIIQDGDYKTVSCIGDVGNPSGVLQAEKRLTDGRVVKLEPLPNSTDETTGNCSVLQSRLFITQLTADDDKAVFRCFVQSPWVSGDGLYSETDPIDVKYPPRKPYIRSELVANNSHQLACMSAGNPEPSYQWYTFPDADTNTTELYASWQNITIHNVTTPQVFVCRVNNTIGERTYSKETNITISPKGTHADANLGDSFSASAALGVVFGIILAIITCAIVLYLLYRKRLKSSVSGNQYDNVSNERTEHHYDDQPQELKYNNIAFSMH